MRSLVTLLLLVLVSAARGSEADIHVVASVTDVSKSEKPGLEGSYVWLRIHSPLEFQGLQISLGFEGRERGQARIDFPIGSVWDIVLPESERAILQKEKRDEEHVQRQIDSGVPPEMISQLVIGPQLSIGELPVTPVRRPME